MPTRKHTDAYDEGRTRALRKLAWLIADAIRKDGLEREMMCAERAASASGAMPVGEDAGDSKC